MNQLEELIKPINEGITGTIKKHPWISMIFGLLVLSILLIVFMITYQRIIFGWSQWADWTGFGEYTGNLSKDQRGKTLWDWLDLALIPLLLSIVTAGFALLNIKAEDRAEEQRRITNEWERASYLQDYFAKMYEILRDLRMPDYQPAENFLVSLAQSQTLTVLRIIDGNRKGLVIRFLEESELIIGENAKIKLVGADLRGANLQDALLIAANLSHTNLRNSNFQGANLNGAYLSFSNIEEANLENADLSNSQLGLANFKNANLRNAKVTNEQLADVISLEGAIMPDGRIYDPQKHFPLNYS